MSAYVDKIRELGTKRQRYIPNRDELLAEIERVIENRARGGFKHVSTSIESDGQHKFYGIVLTFLPWASSGRSCDGGHVEVFDTDSKVIKELLRPPDHVKEFTGRQIDAVLKRAFERAPRGDYRNECLKKFIDDVRDELHVLKTGKHLPTLANMSWIIKRAQDNSSTMFAGQKFSRESEEYLIKEIHRLLQEAIDWNQEESK